MSRVLTIGPMPAEKCAYALARYSRSPDSIRDSIAWVRTHDSRKFLESFYFQYGHASIADLGHVVVCFEGISELAATEIEDEQLWDGQARSSRYQDFSKSGFVTPPELAVEHAGLYRSTGERLIDGYKRVHSAVVEHLRDQLPRPDDMKPDAYERNIAARAFDVARYLLFLGIPTGVGQVVSIRTLERQVRRMKASEHAELRELGDELAAACAASPACTWNDALDEPVAPTLAKYVDADTHLATAREDLRVWARQNLPHGNGGPQTGCVDLLKPASAGADIVATLLYPVTGRPFRELYEWAEAAGEGLRREVIDTALRSRTRRDELLRAFRTATYVYDIVCDIGAYRDLHRHRRCQQFRQTYTAALGFETPPALAAAGVSAMYEQLMAEAAAAYAQLGAAAEYILPFGARSRFLFKMDFAEAEYISRLRSGVKGHFSYRSLAWEMKRKMEALEPALGGLIDAVPPSVEDPLKR
jgi:thymidylate synthase ThyX